MTTNVECDPVVAYGSSHGYTNLCNGGLLYCLFQTVEVHLVRPQLMESRRPLVRAGTQSNETREEQFART